MKPQDIIFLLVLLGIIFRRDARLAAFFGIFSLIVSMPLFAFWIFFTAERLTWYAGAFFLVAIILFVIQTKKV